ncbi:uncharacterized protein PGTG_22259 [Puccinia graminis f. sp. tritici CRL 75-36-700-3]|uniref:AB hydrolase-1 domain-containing protein n=1 Tax=Puccinia graminis f. sp. tritici (strain CRL 75-36-700-3 / race SCCL) TaxID=418459 RepID=H6QU32_PUCGT|nr:uncharacterized protein PGTG_22259 [Puccinia graminis f. sp. tritici CRL 75-36-700-3]EHS64445.1 hypothetical protein PGTG_22259 [Puccinia graminis f. sp. tritici CRL 75-36-700-3]
MRIDMVGKPVVGGTLRRTLNTQAASINHRWCGLTSARTEAPSSWKQRDYHNRASFGSDIGHLKLKSFIRRKNDIPTQGQPFYVTTRLASSSSSPSGPGPILLESEKFVPPQSSDHEPHSPIIILHGLFGSKQNWRSLAKRLSQATQKTVFTLDLRNHGESQATPGFTSYLDYSSDVKHFMTTNNLKDVILIGHSMGGKVAMSLALSESSSNSNREGSDLIKKLVAVDISPAKGPISKSFQVYIDGFKEINSRPVSSRKEADEILTKYEPDLGRRQFLLTNLKKVERDGAEGQGTPHYEIRLPVEVLEAQLASNQVGDFPFEIPRTEPAPGSASTQSQPPSVRFHKPSLFIKGARSKYINKYNIPTIAAFFMNHRLVVLDTDHWVHAEKPNEFIQTVVDFVKEE